MRRRSAPTLLLVALLAVVPLARAEEPAADDLLGLDLDELLSVEVTTAARRPQDVFSTPARVHVLTSEDIRRSGARSIPDMLRMIPGVQVAQVSSHGAAVSIRGFNWAYASKLLVLVDGRTVYSTIIAGVDWDGLGILPENIERIEVVSGPAAASWGANAVNGVVNIVTKHASDTQGTLAGMRLASRGRDAVFVRHGMKAAGGALRFDVRLSHLDENPPVPGNDTGSDDWEEGHVAARYDRELRSGSLELSFDALRGRGSRLVQAPLPVPPYASDDVAPVQVAGGSVQGRWTRRRDGGDVTLQAFHSVDRNVVGGFRVRRELSDVEVVADRTAGRHRLAYGGSLRFESDCGSFAGALKLRDIEDRSLLAGAFLRDDMELPIPGLRLVLGAKVEHHEDFGVQLQPEARVAWTSPRGRHAAWASVARAVRTPARVERSIDADIAAFPAGPVTGLLHVDGDPDAGLERMHGVEAGYRFRTSRASSIDVAAFANRYHDVITLVTKAPHFGELDGVPVLVQPAVSTNALDVSTRGVDLSVRWSPVARLSVQAGASWIRFTKQPHEGLVLLDPGQGVDGLTPSHQHFVRAHVVLCRSVALDASWEHVAALRDRAGTSGVPSRDDISLALDFTLPGGASLRLQGDRLFEGTHAEFSAASYAQLRAVGPSTSLLFTWSF